MNIYLITDTFKRIHTTKPWVVNIIDGNKCKIHIQRGPMVYNKTITPAYDSDFFEGLKLVVGNNYNY